MLFPPLCKGRVREGSKIKIFFASILTYETPKHDRLRRDRLTFLYLLYGGNA